MPCDIFQGESRGFFGPHRLAFLRRRPRGAWQVLEPLGEGAVEAFDVAPVLGRTEGSPRQFDGEVFTRALEANRL